MLLELKANNAGEERSKVRFKEESDKIRRNKLSKMMFSNYEIGEIKTFVDIELPKCKHKREKYENERVLMRQLLSNIERNRVKLRQEFFEADNLSHQRKVAISGIKEKVDDQARVLSEELSAIKEKWEHYRRQEDKLRTLKQKIELLESLDNNEEYRREEFTMDVQMDYDKYLKLYRIGDDLKRRIGKNKSEVRKSDFISFQNKWSEYLIEEANMDLKPIINLDPDRNIFQPHSLH